MKNIRIFISENFHFLVVQFSVYLNRRVFVMLQPTTFSILVNMVNTWHLSSLGTCLTIVPQNCSEIFHSLVDTYGKELR